MIRKLILPLLFFFSIFYLFKPQSISAQNTTFENVNVYFFWGEGCPHCAKEKIYLEKLKNKYPDVNIKDYEIYNSEDNRNLFIKVGEKLGINVSGVPVIIIGDKAIGGYFNDETTGKEIENRVIECLESSCPDNTDIIIKEAVKNNLNPQNKNIEKNKDTSQKVPSSIEIPFLGNIETKNLSLPFITLIFAGLDGFNPCAMWVLLFLIGLLLGMQDIKRRWILGGIFIVTSSLVYFVFMAAWLNLILLIGFIIWIRLVVGAVALAGGAYNLKEFFTNKETVCKVTRGNERKMVFEKLKNIAHEKSFLLAMGGIILLAAAVNLVELICSAGLPVVYTQILALSNLASWQYYLYLFFYIFIFMLDDLVVFIVAMKTLEITGITTKYVRYSHLISGILMLIIGILLILKPEILMFG